MKSDDDALKRFEMRARSLAPAVNAYSEATTCAILLCAALSGGPLSGDYAFQQFHLHWGKRDGWGSEHTLDGRAFPAELHIVHKKQEYRSMDEALKHKDGVAVVGFFFDLGAPNVELAQVISSLQKVQYKDDELEDLQPVQFTKFLPTAEDSSSSSMYYIFIRIILLQVLSHSLRAISKSSNKERLAIDNRNRVLFKLVRLFISSGRYICMNEREKRIEGLLLGTEAHKGVDSRGAFHELNYTNQYGQTLKQIVRLN